MHRCSHLYESGRQCSEFALDGSDFCGDHEIIHDAFEPIERNGFRRLLMRVAAVLLLIVFLIPFYYTVKSLLATFEVEMGEAR
jgi:hypothetical protein